MAKKPSKSDTLGTVSNRTGRKQALLDKILKADQSGPFMDPGRIGEMADPFDDEDEAVYQDSDVDDDLTVDIEGAEPIPGGLMTEEEVAQQGQTADGSDTYDLDAIRTDANQVYLYDLPGNRESIVLNDNIVVPEYNDKGELINWGDTTATTGTTGSYLDPELEAAMRELLTPTDTSDLEAQIRAEQEAALGNSLGELAAMGSYGALGGVGGQIAARGQLEADYARELNRQILDARLAAQEQDLARLGLAGGLFDSEAGRQFAADQAQADRAQEAMDFLIGIGYDAILLDELGADPQALIDLYQQVLGETNPELAAEIDLGELTESSPQGPADLPADSVDYDNDFPVSPTDVALQAQGWSKVRSKPGQGWTLVETSRNPDVGTVHYYEGPNGEKVYWYKPLGI